MVRLWVWFGGPEGERVGASFSVVWLGLWFGRTKTGVLCGLVRLGVWFGRPQPEA